MVRRRQRHPDSLRLALDQLILAQAAFLADSRERSREFAEWRRSSQEQFQEIRQILLHLIETLPDAIRSQIGFKPNQA